MRKLVTAAAVIGCLVGAGSAQASRSVKLCKPEVGTVARLGISGGSCTVARLVMIEMSGRDYRPGFFKWQGVQFLAAQENSHAVGVTGGNGKIIVVIITKQRIP